MPEPGGFCPDGCGDDLCTPLGALACTFVFEQAETARPTVTTEDEWGVRYGQSPNVRSQGTGYWAMRHAEQEVQRVRHNATLPSVGQPKTAEVVHRTVTRSYQATEWERAFPPEQHPTQPTQPAAQPDGDAS